MNQRVVFQNDDIKVQLVIVCLGREHCGAFLCVTVRHGARTNTHTTTTTMCVHLHAYERARGVQHFCQICRLSMYGHNGVLICVHVCVCLCVSVTPNHFNKSKVFTIIQQLSRSLFAIQQCFPFRPFLPVNTTQRLCTVIMLLPRIPMLQPLCRGPCLGGRF